MKFEYIAKKDDNNIKVKDVLKNKLYVSNILLKNLREAKSIYVNNIPVFNNYIIKENDILCIDLEKTIPNTKFEDKFNLIDKPLDILYEDDYLLIVNKPANMPVHPSSNNYDNTLSNIVACYLKSQKIYSIHIVTRLDHNTTGICIFAKHSYIQELFLRKKDKINLRKWYTTIVDGIVKNKHDIIEAPISRKENTIILREVNLNGNYAKTEYFLKAINKEKNYTILNVLLHTGRTHQIRVHMSHIGHVLLGDELYASEYNIQNICKYIQRQALHCSKISFNHPITNKSIEIICDLPDDMNILVINSKD